MRYSPKNENTRPLMITILLTVIAVFSILFAGHFQNLKWLFQLSFLCFATAAIQIFMKYVLTKYEYVCDDTSLSIYKIMGRRRICVGILEFSLFKRKLETIADFEDLRIPSRIENILTFTRNYKTKNIYCFVYNYNYSDVMIKLEIDNVFANYVNERVENALKGKAEDENF